MARTLAQIKVQNPQWADIPDTELANRIYDRQYSTGTYARPRKLFFEEMGLDPEDSYTGTA